VTPRVGDAKFVELMEEPGRLANGEPIEYARGLMVDSYRGTRRVQHGGSWIGYRANLLRFPALHTAIAVFCNRDGSQPERLTREIADIVLAHQFPQESAAKQKPAGAKRGKSAAPAVSQLTGVYFGEDDMVFRIVESGGGLALHAFGAVLPLVAAGPTTWALQGYPGTVDFAVRGKSPAERLTLQFEGMSAMSAARIVPPALQASDLAAYAGTFYSPELDVTWDVVVQEGGLAIRQQIAKFTPAMQSLEAALPDAFNGSQGFLRYSRDGSGNVNGFELSAARMRGIRFEKRAPGTEAGK
jgi:hypothetical protein